MIDYNLIISVLNYWGSWWLWITKAFIWSCVYIGILIPLWFLPNWIKKVKEVLK